MAKNMAERKKNTSRSQSTQVKAESVDQQVSDKSVRATPARNERKEPAKQTGKAAGKRDGKGGTGNLSTRWRNNAAGRFIYDAYYELRHKVTWPTLREARNMTAVVIALSVVIGGILAAADYGLHQLFLLIIGQ